MTSWPRETLSHTSLVDPCAQVQVYTGILGQVNWNLLWHQSWKTSKGFFVSLPFLKIKRTWPPGQTLVKILQKSPLEWYPAHPTCHFIKGIFKTEGAPFLRWCGLAHGNQLTGSPSTSWCPEGISESRSNSSRNIAAWNSSNQKTGLHYNLLLGEWRYLSYPWRSSNVGILFSSNVLQNCLATHVYFHGFMFRFIKFSSQLIWVSCWNEVLCCKLDHSKLLNMTYRNSETHIWKHTLEKKTSWQPFRWEGSTTN